MIDLAPKPTPHNPEAEQALLAALLVNNRAFERVADFLRPEHFAIGVHGRIYQAISTLIERGTIASPVTLKRLFSQDDALQECGGGEYISKLACSVITIVNVRDYAETIVDDWMRRQLIDAATETITEAQQSSLEHDAAKIRESLESRLLSLHEIGSGRNTQAPRPLADFGAIAINDAERAFKRKGQSTGVPTELSDFDRLTGGLQPSDLIYIAGRPSMGKSALAGTIAINAALRGHPVFLATPEMSGEQVALRALSIRTRLSSQDIRTGHIEAADFARLIEENDALAKIPIHVDECGGITLAMLRSRVRRFIMQAPRLPGSQMSHLDEPTSPLVIVDYIQLMNTEDRRRQQNRNEDMSELSRGLKSMAKEFGVPVVALSQLSRAVESRDNKRPMLSDLRDSGSLEQDADVVAFVYREEYYLAREEPTRKANEKDDAWSARHADWETRLDRVQNTAELIVTKQRHGPTGKAVLRFNPATTSFENLTRSRWDYQPERSAQP